MHSNCLIAFFSQLNKKQNIEFILWALNACEHYQWVRSLFDFCPFETENYTFAVLLNKDFKWTRLFQENVPIYSFFFVCKIRKISSHFGGFSFIVVRKLKYQWRTTTIKIQSNTTATRHFIYQCKIAEEIAVSQFVICKTLKINKTYDFQTKQNKRKPRTDNWLAISKLINRNPNNKSWRKITVQPTSNK